MPKLKTSTCLKGYKLINLKFPFIEILKVSIGERVKAPSSKLKEHYRWKSKVCRGNYFKIESSKKHILFSKTEFITKPAAFSNH